MDITNRDSYYNSIYQAYIINDDTSADPLSKRRYQIFIPEIHYTIESICEQYSKLSNAEKINSEYFSLFPWAVSLVSDLKTGDIVYGSFIKNQNNQFIILGINANNPEAIGGASTLYSIGTDAILDLAMPIILENEIGLNRNKWPDGITESQYGSVASNDKGMWSIGVIQWHGCRAFDVLYQIAKADPNWLSNWSDQSLSIVKDLQSSIQAGSASPKRNNWNITVYNNAIIKGVKNMLTSSIGKTTQISFGKQETKVLLDILMDEPYGISNPGILIFCMDIMNQYGSGVNSVITGCLTKAAEISKNGKDTMTQLKEYYDYWTGRTSSYSSRRLNTYKYLESLEKQGKLTALTFVDLTILEGLKYVPEYGEYFWPVPSTDYISCFWGEGKKPLPYTFKYNSPNTYQGYSSWNRPHKGIDIAGKTGCEVIAVGSGTVSYVCTTGKVGGGPSQGNCIGIRMDKNQDHYFVYMHLCKPPTLKVGDRVKAGDVVGYMGTTGNSTGTHLHIGLHLKATWPSPQDLTTMIDPLPFFGKKARA